MRNCFKYKLIHESCVFARLIVKGKDYGVKNFIVPLRNPDDFALNVGVNIGDCGAKMV